MAASSLSLSSKPSLSLFNLNPRLTLHARTSCVPFAFTPLSRKETAHSPSPHLQIPLKTNAQIWRISAVPEDLLPSDAKPIENSQQIVPTNGDGVSVTISVLLFLAFVGLSILTIGVVYIAVTDFFQKREADKFEKEEASKKKKKRGGKRRTARARAGPRGFGQKIDEDNDYDDDDD